MKEASRKNIILHDFIYMKSRKHKLSSSERKQKSLAAWELGREKRGGKDHKKH